MTKIVGMEDIKSGGELGQELQQGGKFVIYQYCISILVITFISDDDGNNEVNSPQEAFHAVLAAKNGDLDKIVTLGLIPAEDNNCSFTPGAGDHWLEFIDNFGVQGLHGPSCDDDYVQFFQDAVDTIIQACQSNPPM